MSLAINGSEPIGRDERPSDLKRLAVASAIFAACLAGPAWLVAGEEGFVGLSLAAILCFVPGCLVVAFKQLIGDSQVVLTLASSGLRMFFVLLGAFLVNLFAPDFGLREFFVWLLLFYLFVLGFESYGTLTRLRQTSA